MHGWPLKYGWHVTLLSRLAACVSARGALGRARRRVFYARLPSTLACQRAGVAGSEENPQPSLSIPDRRQSDDVAVQLDSLVVWITRGVRPRMRGPPSTARLFVGPSANCIDRPLRSVFPPVLCPAPSSCPALPCAGHRLLTHPLPGAVFLLCPVCAGRRLPALPCAGHRLLTHPLPGAIFLPCPALCPAPSSLCSQSCGQRNAAGIGGGGLAGGTDLQPPINTIRPFYVWLSKDNGF